MTNASFLDRESEPDVLRAFGKMALAEIERLAKKLADLQSQGVDAEALRLGFEDQLLKLKKKLFFRGKEGLEKKITPKKVDGLLVHGEPLNPDPKKAGTAKDRDLVTEDAFYSMPPDELRKEAESRGMDKEKLDDWKEMNGLFDEATEITIVERTYKKVIHKRKKYIYVPSIGSDKEIIVTAKGPEKLLAGGGFSLDFAISATVDKFQYHQPLNRQVEQMEMRGLAGITAKTLYGLTEALSGHVRKSGVLEKIRKDIFTANLAVHADETPWPILSDHDSDGYLWTICNMAGAYYRFEPSRSGKIVVEMLKGYGGPIVSDDFKGYDRLKRETSCKLCHCWAHARRNFYEIRENYFEDCREIIILIDELFEIERQAKTFSALKALRDERSGLVIALIHDWLTEKAGKYLLKKSGMGKAIRYILGNWGEFTAFLSDVRVPLSNNHAERSLRHSVLGRNNFYGSKTINGADVAADHYTIIKTCKLLQLDPSEFYRYLVATNNAGGEALSPLQYVRWKYEQKLLSAAPAKGELS
jgi:transposase